MNDSGAPRQWPQEVIQPVRANGTRPGRLADPAHGMDVGCAHKTRYRAPDRDIGTGGQHHGRRMLSAAGHASRAEWKAGQASAAEAEAG